MFHVVHAVARVLFVLILIHQLFSVDVSEAAEEGQGAQSVGMSDPYITSHPLDQASEALQLCHHVVCTPYNTCYTVYNNISDIYIIVAGMLG